MDIWHGINLDEDPDVWYDVNLSWHGLLCRWDEEAKELQPEKRRLPVELYPHQQKAVDMLHNGSILWGGVGTGKTITSLVYFYTKVCGGVIGDLGSMRHPIDLYIITTAKKRDSLDWDAEAQKLVITKRQDASVSGIQMTVDSWNNIDKYAGVKDAFFIFDEQRLVGAGAWSKAFIKIAKHNKWILLTATPGDTWLDYIPVFVANGFYKNRTEFKRRHVVYNNYSKFPKVDHYVETGRLVKLRNSILVHMPYAMETVRQNTNVIVDYDKDKYDKVVTKRWHVYEDRPLRDVGELFNVMRKVVNSDSSRLRAIRELMSLHPKLIVFYNFDYELEALRTLAGRWTEDDGTGEEFLPCEDDFAVAEWNGHKHEPIPQTDRWVYLVQYVAGSEGWNCTDTDAMCFYSLTYSYKNFHQAHGRIDRLDTNFIDLYYYTLVSNASIDKMVQKALRSKKNFQPTRAKLS